MKILILLLLLCGEWGETLTPESQTVEIRVKSYDFVLCGALNQLPLRRIKDTSWNFNTRIGKVILTSERFETHIQVKHPFVTIEAIRKALEHPAVKYKSRKRWCFEKDGLRVVIGKDNKVVTAYYITGE